MADHEQVVIVGAGPYGLSIAAHLRAYGIGFRIFGKPMDVWRNRMPKGMWLKSDGFATDIYDPARSFTLRHFCAERGIPYADMGLPVHLDTFVAYGLAFQERFVSDLDERDVVDVERTPEGFAVRLEDGATLYASNVVAAVGISHFPYVPEAFLGLPRNLVSHSSDHSDLDRFKGRDVIVVGAGASALDTAALLRREGSAVQLVARRPAIPFHNRMPHPRPLTHRIRAPMTGLGTGWRNIFCAHMPLLFHVMPEPFRLEVVRRHLGPAPGWFTREQTEGKMPFILGATATSVAAQGDRIRLEVRLCDNSARVLEGDHLIAATGYKVDLRRVPFLNEGICAAIRTVDHAPVLSAHFESSLPGLYFVGLAAANCFGPLLRFALGADFTARRLSKHLARRIRKARHGASRD